jgi:coenzyme PQQ synthesis protein D (PqqD)
MRETVVSAQEGFGQLPDRDEFYCDLLAPEVTDILRRVTAPVPSQLPGVTETSGLDRKSMQHANTALMAHFSREGHMKSPVVRPAESIREVQNGDGAVLLDIGQGTCYSMNPIGTRIWQLLKLNYSTEQIAATLATEFGADHSRVREDVIEYTENLRRNGLLITPAAVQTRKLIPRCTSAIRRFVSSIASRHADERKP